MSDAPIARRLAAEMVALRDGPLDAAVLGTGKDAARDLTPDDLALWNSQMKHVVEPGTFTVSSGPDSATLKSATLMVR